MVSECVTPVLEARTPFPLLARTVPPSLEPYVCIQLFTFRVQRHGATTTPNAYYRTHSLLTHSRRPSSTHTTEGSHRTRTQAHAAHAAQHSTLTLPGTLTLSLTLTLTRALCLSLSLTDSLLLSPLAAHSSPFRALFSSFSRGCDSP